MEVNRLISWRTAALAAALASLASVSHAASVFSDNYNRANLNIPDLVYVGPDGTAATTSAYIDSAFSGTRGGVMSFGEATIGGDAFAVGKAFSVLANVPYQLTFDYAGAVDGNGFIGLADGTPGNHYWLGGTVELYISSSGLNLTVTPGASGRVLADDDDSTPEESDFNTYTFTFESSVNQTLHMMFEDFSPALNHNVDPGGHAYFDNVSVVAVPLPPGVLAGGSLMGLLGVVNVVRRRSISA